jgi:hypothetical protein
MRTFRISVTVQTLNPTRAEDLAQRLEAFIHRETLDLHCPPGSVHVAELDTAIGYRPGPRQVADHRSPPALVQACPACKDFNHQKFTGAYVDGSERTEIWHCSNPKCLTAVGSTGEGGSHSHILRQ